MHAQYSIALLHLQNGRPADRVLLTVQSELSMERHGALFGSLDTDLLEPCLCKCFVVTDLQVFIFHVPVAKPDSRLEGRQVDLHGSVDRTGSINEDQVTGHCAGPGLETTADGQRTNYRYTCRLDLIRVTGRYRARGEQPN